jgi:hypothetical protein
VTGESWAPTLPDVARHIPTRTRDVRTPGSDKLLGTFTTTTTPSGDQAQAVIDTVVGTLLASVGALPDNHPDLYVSARSACEWRAAADIEIAYPNRDADVAVYEQLDARAQAAWSAFTTALANIGGSPTGPDDLPMYQFPPGPPWGDLSPGSGADPYPWLARNRYPEPPGGWEF